MSLAPTHTTCVAAEHAHPSLPATGLTSQPGGSSAQSSPISTPSPSAAPRSRSRPSATSSSPTTFRPAPVHGTPPSPRTRRGTAPGPVLGHFPAYLPGATSPRTGSVEPAARTAAEPLFAPASRRRQGSPELATHRLALLVDLHREFAAPAAETGCGADRRCRPSSAAGIPRLRNLIGPT